MGHKYGDRLTQDERMAVIEFQKPLRARDAFRVPTDHPGEARATWNRLMLAQFLGQKASKGD